HMESLRNSVKHPLEAIKVYATARDAVLRETCRFTIPPVARQDTRSLFAPLPAHSRSVLHVLEEPHGISLYRHPDLFYQASVTMFQISLLFLTFALENLS